jgi:hypothetical protein
LIQLKVKFNCSSIRAKEAEFQQKGGVAASSKLTTDLKSEEEKTKRLQKDIDDAKVVLKTLV